MNVDFKIDRNGEFVQSLLGENLGISSPSPCLVQISWGPPKVWLERCEKERFQVVGSLYPPWSPPCPFLWVHESKT